MGGRPPSYAREALVADKPGSRRLLLRVATARGMRSRNHTAGARPSTQTKGLGLTADSSVGGVLQSPTPTRSRI
jgi:hypothetical protein